MAKDWLGRDINKGDLIVYPVREGAVMDVVLARVVYERNTGELEVDRIRVSGGKPVGRRVRGLVQRTDRVTLVNTHMSEQLTAAFMGSLS